MKLWQRVVERYRSAMREADRREAHYSYACNTETCSVGDHYSTGGGS